MYDIKWIREHPEDFDRGLKRRGLEPLSAKLIAIDGLRRGRINALESWQQRRNEASKKIGQAKKAKDEAGVGMLMAEVAECKTSIATLEAEVNASDAELSTALAEIPNLPLDDVPEGADEHDNVERHKSGAKREYSFKPKEHFDLGTALGMMDFELAAKLSGARFVVLQKGLARMERALGQFMLDLHTGDKHGYTEVNPPLMVLDQAMFGTAQLPKFEEDQFAAVNLREFASVATGSEKLLEAYANALHIEEYQRTHPDEADLEQLGAAYQRTADVAQEQLRSSGRKHWLIPTAEVPLTNLVRESIVDESSLPRRYTACTPCFRAEAGAAGKDTRGMIRQHQFTKVELVSITTPEKSKEEHERMLACAEEVLKKLDLHYRVITLCTGDMGFAAQKTYDIEVWLPGQNMYREISSCSVCGEFQARRMNARYRGKDNKPAFVHTLNGSGVAVGRALIAVMETYQQKDGSILVPDALKPYMGGMMKIEKK
jgi:seryl-tRNA synthetase